MRYMLNNNIRQMCAVLFKADNNQRVFVDDTQAINQTHIKMCKAHCECGAFVVRRW